MNRIYARNGCDKEVDIVGVVGQHQGKEETCGCGWTAPGQDSQGMSQMIEKAIFRR